MLLLVCSAAALYIKDGKIYDEQGDQVTMHGACAALLQPYDAAQLPHAPGIHLFGLNTDANVAALPWGQDKPQESAYVDWKTVVWRNRQLGFNAVRLPFNFFFLVWVPAVDRGCDYGASDRRTSQWRTIPSHAT